MPKTMDSSLTSLLGNLAASLESAASTLPDKSSVLPPKDGISLLDVKNELLLSYLQNLAFLILIKIRNGFKAPSTAGDEVDSEGDSISILNDEVVKKLVGLRVYMEKGVRPLEGRLKYQIDKVIRAADDLTRSASTSSGVTQQSSRQKRSDGDRDSDDDEEDGGSAGEPDTAQIDELSYRPNPSAFQRPAAATTERASSTTTNTGIYKPPRITPTAPPEMRSREDRAERRPGRSATMDEYVMDEEFSVAPVAQPSLGSNIRAGGRSVKTARERAADQEKREYEESNFVRLPKESKKERSRKGRKREAGYGGEDWRSLGAGLDRIERLTQRKKGAGVVGALGSSRKRAVEDGPRGSGELGDEFARRRKKALRR